MINLANSGELPCIKVAGEYMRYRKRDILLAKEGVNKKYPSIAGSSRLGEAIREFLHFYDFYLISAVVIIALLWVILKDLRS